MTQGVPGEDEMTSRDEQPLGFEEWTLVALAVALTLLMVLVR